MVLSALDVSFLSGGGAGARRVLGAPRFPFSLGDGVLTSDVDKLRILFDALDYT